MRPPTSRASLHWPATPACKLSLDLIFATPGETLDEWAADLEAAIALEPDHISTYGLTFERGTAFWTRRERGELAEVDEELQREMYALAIDRLTAAGYEHYEVSNFARPGRRSRHNQVYWSGDGYFAAGPGAARYVDGVRETNHRSTTTYLQRVLAGESPVAEREQLDAEARARELLVFGLRRIEGVARRDFAARTGFEIDELDRRAAQEIRRPGLARRRWRASSPHARRPLRQRRDVAGDAVRMQIEMFDRDVRSSILTSLRHLASNIPTAAPAAAAA